MAPYDQFEREVKELIFQGCSLDDAIKEAIKNYSELANQADDLLIIKQKLEREIRGFT
jgi:hypothetical protein